MGLKHWFKQCRLALLVFLLVLPAGLVYGAPDIMPVADLKPGMQGIAKTVVNGTKLEEFGVEVLGIMKDKGPSGDLILVRTYGDLIERTGGIAQGMSGSPVYIDGKLVGAIAYGWSLTDHKIGMLTPISDMLKLWDLPDKKNTALKEPEIPGFEKAASPVMAAGFSENALNMLKEKLKPYQLVPYAVGDAPSDTQYDPLEPGSAVGVQLIRGDVSLGALGTVTYVEGDKVLAFGHPFLKKGNVGYFMTNAYVFTTVKGLENSFKVGTTGEPVGLINQDRGAAVAGNLGRFPNIVPLRVTVKDKSTGKTMDSAMQVIQDEQLSPILSATAMFNVMDKVMDRVGSGSAKVSFEIMARNMPGDILKRENMFYSPGSIGEYAVGEFFEAMSLLADNQFNPVDIMDVKVNVTVEEERRTAAILEAQAKTASAKPGDKVDIAVKLKPFRGEAFTKTVSYTIPKEQPEGPLTLEVRGGGMVPLTQLLLKKQGLDEDLFMPSKDRNKKKSFAEIIKNFTERDRNNDIVVEVLKLDLPELGGEGKGKKEKADPISYDNAEAKEEPAPSAKAKGAVTGKGDKKAAGAKSIVSTDFIIDGDTQVLINVVKEKNK